MKVTSIKYGKLVSLGKYENERYDIEMELQEGDTVQDVWEAARGAVERAIEIRKEDDEARARAEAEAVLVKKREWARGIMANVTANETWDVREAANILGVPDPFAKVGTVDDMPF